MSNKDCLDIKTLVLEADSIDKLELSCDEPNIQDILDYKADVKIVKCKIIKICSSYRLVIKGIKTIKVRYSSKNTCGKIYIKNFIVPFFQSVPIEPYVYSISIVPKLSFYDIDILNCNTFIFNNILTFYIKLSFKPTIPKVNCDCLSDTCNDDWHFKNDCYPSSCITPNKSIYGDSTCNSTSFIYLNDSDSICEDFLNCHDCYSTQSSDEHSEKFNYNCKSKDFCKEKKNNYRDISDFNNSSSNNSILPCSEK